MLLKHGIEAPKTHNLQVLLGLLPASVPVPPEVSQATELTDYAVALRYPAESEPTTPDEHLRAIEQARAVVAWAERVLPR